MLALECADHCCKLEPVRRPRPVMNERRRQRSRASNAELPAIDQRTDFLDGIAPRPEHHSDLHFFLTSSASRTASRDSSGLHVSGSRPSRTHSAKYATSSANGSRSGAGSSLKLYSIVPRDPMTRYFIVIGNFPGCQPPVTSTANVAYSSRAEIR